MDNLELPGSKIMKSASIALIILSTFVGISTILSFLSLTSVASIVEDASHFEEFILIRRIYLGIGLITVFLQFACGLLGLIHKNNHTQAKLCMIFGSITIVSAIISFMITPLTLSTNSVFDNPKFIEIYGYMSVDIISLAIGCIIPLIYIYGAYKNYKEK